MKVIISFAIGILIFIGCFLVEINLINWIVSGLEGHNLRIIIGVILFIIGFGTTLWLAVILGILFGSGIYYLIKGR